MNNNNISNTTYLLDSIMTSLSYTQASPLASPLAPPEPFASSNMAQHYTLEELEAIMLPPPTQHNQQIFTPTVNPPVNSQQVRHRPASLTLLKIPSPKNVNTTFSFNYDPNATLIFEYKGCKLYIGALEHSIDINMHKSKNITAIVSAIPEESSAFHPEINSDNYNLLRISVHDSYTNGLTLNHFKEFEDFINTQFEEGRNILVHCHMGISRSVTLVISWIMKYFNLTDREACKLVNSKRPQASPNFYFCCLLHKYNRILTGEVVSP